jgi:hypothetical protein
MLPDKSIATLVKYYYSWKKTRTRTSLMDRQARKLQAVRAEGRYGEEAEPSEEEEEEEEDKEVRDIFLGENYVLCIFFCQCCGSVGSVCFWASSIRIRIH